MIEWSINNSSKEGKMFKVLILMIGMVVTFPVYAQEAIAPQEETMTEYLQRKAAEAGSAVSDVASTAKEKAVEFTTAPAEDCTFAEVGRGVVVGAFSALVVGVVSAYSAPIMAGTAVTATGVEGAAMSTFGREAMKNSVVASVVTVPLSVMVACGM
jgi:hypothetical protein